MAVHGTRGVGTGMHEGHDDLPESKIYTIAKEDMERAAIVATAMGKIWTQLQSIGPESAVTIRAAIVESLESNTVPEFKSVWNPGV